MEYLAKLLVAYVFAVCILSCKSKDQVQQSVTIQHYASGSAIAFRENKIYLMGDDMNYLLSLDKSLAVVDSILLEDSAKYQIPKPLKQDIEAATFLNNSDNLLMLGSGSLSPHRNSCWLVNTTTKDKQTISLETFYNRIKASGITELNIEGLTSVKDHLILSNRGNKGLPYNHLIITAADFYQQQVEAPITKIELQNPSTNFSGVSGLEYSSKHDMLLLSVSTEETYDTHADGAIGKSYLWIIHSFSTKLHQQQLKPDRIIDLTSLGSQFKDQKIESVCILSETTKELELVFVADNDNGSSTLFKVSLKL